MFNDDNGGGAGNLLTLLFGIAVGVAGTLIYAAANEDQFTRALKKTKLLTGQAGDKLNDYVDDASSKVKAISDSVQDNIEAATNKVKGVATNVADDVEHKAKQAKREINS